MIALAQRNREGDRQPAASCQDPSPNVACGDWPFLNCKGRGHSPFAQSEFPVQAAVLRGKTMKTTHFLSCAAVLAAASAQAAPAGKAPVPFESGRFAQRAVSASPGSVVLYDQ